MDKKGDKDKRRKREKGELWKEARGRGMMGGPSQLSPRNRSEPELKTSAPCSAKPCLSTGCCGTSGFEPCTLR